MLSRRINTIVCKVQKRPSLIPKNKNQETYISMLRRNNPNVIIAHGPAGCGKTLCGLEVGLEKLKEGEYNKLVFLRPAVPVDSEEHGFLPGNLNSKMLPWLMPIYDILYKHYDVVQVDRMMENRVIEIAPLAFLRGRTFDDSWMILEEGQNCSVSQMKMVLTRIGKNSKLIITGDPLQHDNKDFSGNGLVDLCNRVRKCNYISNDIGEVKFDVEDIERSQIAKLAVQLYGDSY